MPRESVSLPCPRIQIRNDTASTKIPSNVSSQKFARSPSCFARLFSRSHDAVIFHQPRLRLIVIYYALTYLRTF
jgi:hypothetical protein